MSDLQKLPQGEKREAGCKACASMEAEARYAYSYDSNTHEILQCLDCGHMFMHPVPLIELDSRTMYTLDDAELFGSSIMRSLYAMGVINREVRKVRQHLTKERPGLLDIGCGTGWNSSLWQKKGFDVTGLEPSQTRREFGEKKYGLKMIDCHVEELHTLDNFDVVVMRHVLEHFAEPFSVLEKVHNLLNPGGLIVIALPNINSIGRYIFKEDWEWVLPWHLNFFTSRSLQFIVKKAGFEPVHTYQTPSPIWYPHVLSQLVGGETVIGRMIGRPGGVLGIISSIPFVALGMLLNLNDNLTIIAKRRA